MRKSMRGGSLQRIIWTALTAVFILFIFSNSLQPGTESSGKSTHVLEIIRQTFQKAGWQIPVTEHIIRKSGHFAEYAVLGILLAKTGQAYAQMIQKYLFPVLFFALAVPVADENIQLFVQGRSGEVRDVALDFAGAAAGILLFLVVHGLRCICKKRRETRSHVHLGRYRRKW